MTKSRLNKILGYLCTLEEGRIMKITEEIKKRSGTSFRGYLYAEYDEVIEKFGKPHTLENNHKIDVEWIVATPYGPATIYNYKDGCSYLGDSGLDVTAIYEWHIGGKNNRVVEYIEQRLRSH